MRPDTLGLVTAAGEEQRFDFGVLSDEEGRPARRHETPEELVARVEAVHARASRARSRRQQVSSAADEYLAAFPIDEIAAPEHEIAAEAPIAADPLPAKSTRRRPIDATSAAPDAALPDVDTVEEPLDGDPDGALTIADFYERVRRALATEFPDEVWVTGEIRGFRESRGHRYLELADAGAESATGRGAAQQLEVVCWAREWPPIGHLLAEAGVDLEVGRVVRVRGKVSVWEGGSKLRFTLTALDVEALLGGIAAARRRLLLALEAEGLLEKNRRLPLPIVPLRIGLVTSPGSEAHRDFVGQLDRSGFAFDVHLEPSLVQGTDAPVQIVAALERLEAFAPDLAVIVRGGGARGDLAAFDSESVARAIAAAPFPVWAGVGHTGDHSVADEVVAAAWITPTACGEAVVARVASFWSEIEHGARALVTIVTSRLVTVTDRLASVESGLARSARHQLDRRSAELAAARASVVRATATELRGESTRVAYRAVTLRDVARRALSSEGSNLDRRTQVLRAFDPTRQLERGWSLTHRDGVVVRSYADVEAGQTLVTRLVDGEVRSTVTGATIRVDATTTLQAATEDGSRT